VLARKSYVYGALMAQNDLPEHGLVDQKTLAAYLDRPERTLEDWRLRGRGPAYVRVGQKVRYRVRDVERWLDANTVSPGAA
jgi:hypothetical protein